jgi:hypothetical protein
MFEVSDLMSFYVEQGFVEVMASNGVDSERVVEFDDEAYPFAGQNV